MIECKKLWWSMHDLEKLLGRKQKWIKKHILYRPQFREVLDTEKGGFVYYPKSKNEQWTFHALKMKSFLDENFAEIHKRKIT